MTVTIQGPERNLVITRNITRTIAVQSSGVSNLVGTVRYDVAQSMTSPEKLQAWANITGIPLGLSVDSASPTLTLTQIGAGLALYTTGGITAGAFTGPLAGNASSATVLATPRAINGVSFDGSAAITVTAAAGTLTGSDLNATVTGSSLTTVGTLVSLAVTGAVSAGSFAGPLTGNVTGDVSGNAGTVTNGVYTTGSYADPAWITSLAGSKVTGAIAGTAAAGTLTGTTLAANVVSSSLTSVGTLASLAVTGAVTAGSFAGPLTGNVTGNVSGSSGSTTGNAATATALQTARAINDVNFDGTAAITITAAAGTLTGATLNATVTASSLTSLGTLSSLAVGGAQTITLNSASAGLTITQSGAGAALSTNGQIVSTLATGTSPFAVASTTVVTNLNAQFLSGATFAAPGAIGGTTPAAAAFTTVSATGQITSTLATGTAPFSVASTTNVANLNASSLSGATFAAPGTIGGGTPGAATFTTLTATGQVSLGGAAGAESLRAIVVASAVNRFDIYGAATGSPAAILAAGSDATVPIGLYAKGAGTVFVVANGALSLVSANPANAVNYLDLRGSATGNEVTISAVGSDTNAGTRYIAKAAGVHRFETGGGEQFRAAHTASAVDYLFATGSSAAFPGLYAAGASTDVNVVVSGKGTGGVFVCTNGGTVQFLASHMASAVNYLQATGSVTGSPVTLIVSGSDTNQGMYLAAKGTSSMRFATGGGDQFRINHTASAVNYVIALGGATGTGPTLYADGSDANPNFIHSLKGGGSHLFYTGSTSVIQFAIAHTASAVNFPQATGGTTGNPVVASAQGSDSHIDFAVTPKGANGRVRFGTHSALGAETVTGYIEIKDAGGTVRKLAVVS